MLLLTLGCFQIADPFHDEEPGTGEAYAAENSHYLKLDSEAELIFESTSSQDWVGQMSKSDYPWGISWVLPEGLPSANLLGFEAISLLRTDSFSLAIDLQQCKLYSVNFEGNLIPMDLTSCNFGDSTSATLVGGRLTVLVEPNNQELTITLLENGVERGEVTLLRVAGSGQGAIVLGGVIESNNYPIASPGLSFDQLVFLSPTSLDSVPKLQENHPYGNNQQLWEELAEGAYFFPLGEGDGLLDVADITLNYYGQISQIPEGQESSFYALP